MKYARACGAWISRQVDRRDVLGAAGLGLLGYGGEMLYPGVGFAASGAVMVAIAAFGVRYY